MTNFISINEVRIHKNTIKKYCPNGDTKLNIYYNTSRTKIEVEIFSFDTKEERNNMLFLLDTLI